MYRVDYYQIGTKTGDAMKKIALLLSFVLAMSVSGCSKSSEEIALEVRLGAFEAIDEERPTWDKLGQLDTSECNQEIRLNRVFMRWSWDADSCSKSIQEVLAPLKILETKFSAIDDDWFLIRETKASLAELAGLQYCNESNFEDEICEIGMARARELYDLDALIERWYKWKASV